MKKYFILITLSFLMITQSVKANPADACEDWKTDAQTYFACQRQQFIKAVAPTLQDFSQTNTWICKSVMGPYNRGTYTEKAALQADDLFQKLSDQPGHYKIENNKVKTAIETYSWATLISQSDSLVEDSGRRAGSATWFRSFRIKPDTKQLMIETNVFNQFTVNDVAEYSGSYPSIAPYKPAGGGYAGQFSVMYQLCSPLL